MNIFLVVLQSVLVLLGIGVIGFWITRRGMIPESVLGFLSRLATDIALPSMVFANIMVNFSPSKFPDWWQLPLYWFLFAGISLCLTLATMFLSQKETRGEFAINLFYQNGLFFPLVIIGGVFGADDPTYLPQLYIFIMLHPIMFFTTYHLFFKSKMGVKIPWNRVFNPILIATALAVSVQLFGVRDYLPDFIQSIFRILGGMALPLILIILGGSLYLDFKQKGRIYYAEIFKFLLIKNAVFPLVFLALLAFFRPGYNIALLFILESAVPPITATPIFTERAGGNKAISSQFVLSSFVVSVITLPLVFQLFSSIFPMP